MTKAPKKTDVTMLEIFDAYKIARGMLDAFTSQLLDTPKSRQKALKMLKVVIGTLRVPPNLRERPKVEKTLDYTDVLILASVKEFGSLPKAVKAFCDAGLIKPQSISAHVKYLRRMAGASLSDFPSKTTH